MVIPVLNEEDAIGGCLESLAVQEHPVDEVVVVDNNCTDRTIEIVQSFAGRLPLRIVQEARPGVFWARERGFQTAQGDLLGRIDADTRVNPGWSRAAVEFFDAHPDIAAASGPTYLHDAPFAGRYERRVHEALADPERRAGRVNQFLSGANMVVRRSAWEAARPFQIGDDDIHEDIDLGIALEKAGCTKWMLPTMHAAQSCRRYMASPVSNLRYALASPRTYLRHGDPKRARRARLLMPIWLATVWTSWIVLLPYDRATQTWSLRHVVRRRADRITPVRANQ